MTIYTSELTEFHRARLTQVSHKLKMTLVAQYLYCSIKLIHLSTLADLRYEHEQLSVHIIETMDKTKQFCQWDFMRPFPRISMCNCHVTSYYRIIAFVLIIFMLSE